MRALATASSVLAAMLLLLPWQICTCTEDAAHLKPLWDHSECSHEQDEPGHDDSGHDDSGDDESEVCDKLFRFAGSEGDVVLDLPRAEEAGGSLLFSVAMLRVIEGEVPARVEDPPDSANERTLPPSPVRARTRLLL